MHLADSCLFGCFSCFNLASGAHNVASPEAAQLLPEQNFGHSSSIAEDIGDGNIKHRARVYVTSPEPSLNVNPLEY